MTFIEDKTCHSHPLLPTLQIVPKTARLNNFQETRQPEPTERELAVYGFHFLSNLGAHHVDDFIHINLYWSEETNERGTYFLFP